MSRNIAPSGRVRLEDVAAAAGVSAMTVSRALHEPQRLHPQTLRAILAKVRELGYLPNKSARSLASKRSRIVAAVVPTLSYSVYAGTLQGLSDGLRECRLRVDAGRQRLQRAQRAIPGGGLHRPRRRMRWCSPASSTTGKPATSCGSTGLPVAEIWDIGRDPLELRSASPTGKPAWRLERCWHRSGGRHWGFIGSLPAREHRSRKRMEGFERAAREAGCPGRRLHSWKTRCRFDQARRGCSPTARRQARASMRRSAPTTSSPARCCRRPGTRGGECRKTWPSWASGTSTSRRLLDPALDHRACSRATGWGWLPRSH